MGKEGFSFGAKPGEPVVQMWQDAAEELRRRLGAHRDGRSPPASPEHKPVNASQPVIIGRVTRVSKQDAQRLRDADADLSPVTTTLVLTAAAQNLGLFDDEDAGEGAAPTSHFWLTLFNYLKSAELSASTGRLKQFTVAVYKNADVVLPVAITAAELVGEVFSKPKL